MDPDRALVEAFHKRLQKELRETEKRVIEYWRSELEKIYRKRHEGLGPLQLEISRLMERMSRRLQLLRKVSE